MTFPDIVLYASDFLFTAGSVLAFWNPLFMFFFLVVRNVEVEGPVTEHTKILVRYSFWLGAAVMSIALLMLLTVVPPDAPPAEWRWSSSCDCPSIPPAAPGDESE